MKKYLVLAGMLVLTACQTYAPRQYVANMYAKGSLTGYENTGNMNEANTNCPGCHVKNFDRAKLTVEEIVSERGIEPVLVACQVTVIDSLDLKNISEMRYIPATDPLSCETVFEKEKSYLKAMGFAE